MRLTAHARSDADVLIIQTAINTSRTVNTVLVGEDTDLLVLLLYHAHMDGRSCTSNLNRNKMLEKYDYGILKCQRNS